VIRKLRIKFICVIMVIVMLLLGSILGVVIHFTGQNMQMQSISMMRTIATSPMQQGIPGKIHDDQVRLPFFMVQISSQGELIAASGGYFDLTDREYLQEIVNSALLSNGEIGELYEHDLRFLKSVSPRGLPLSFPIPPQKAPRCGIWFTAVWRSSLSLWWCFSASASCSPVG